jgi:hypothetical protein
MPAFPSPSPISDPMEPLIAGPEMLQLSDWERLFSWWPWIGPQVRLFRRYRSQLQNRNPAACMSRWPDDPEVRSVMTIISDVLCDYIGWPPRRFLPEDRFVALCWDPTGDLLDVETILAMERALGIADEVETLLEPGLELDLLEVVQSLCELRRTLDG